MHNILIDIGIMYLKILVYLLKKPLLPNHGRIILYGAPIEYFDFGSEDFKRILAVSGWHAVNTG